MKRTEYQWVDEFIRNISPYVFVRTEDNVLIRKPNHAQKINATGAKILKALLDGNSINNLFSNPKFDEVKQIETVLFLSAIKKSLEGNLDIFTCNPAVEINELKTPFTSLPVLSEIAITQRCNLKCLFCYAGINGQASTSPPDLGTKDIKKLIYKIRYEAQVPSISFSGGEPTLRKDLPELIKYAKDQGMRVNLITNGTFLDKNLSQKLKKAGLDTAQISIEGSNAKVHDEIVGVKGSFNKAIEGIRNLQSLSISVHANTTLNKTNALDVTNLPFFYHSIGLDRFSMNLVIPTGSTCENPEIMMSYEEASVIVDKVRTESIARGIEFMWYSPFPIRLYNTIVKELGNKGCAACDGLLSVNSEGQVIPCASWNEPVGNLLNHSFSEIWNSDRSSIIRMKHCAPEECDNCDNFNVCQGACPLYWKIFGTNEIMKYCRQNKSNGNY